MFLFRYIKLSAVPVTVLLFHPYSTATENKPVQQTGNNTHIIKSDSSIIDPEGSESISIQQYQDRITRLEQNSGVYDSRLGEVLFALGKLYQVQGNHGEAIKAFERALHINKVNRAIPPEPGRTCQSDY